MGARWSESRFRSLGLGEVSASCGLTSFGEAKGIWVRKNGDCDKSPVNVIAGIFPENMIPACLQGIG